MIKNFSQAEALKARLIAFYLPQYHPIPENDEWWGKGFTEWTNVAKAKPLFRGHHQPNLPADLGFYDLRISEVREAQADLAREHGIEGFCYWHYWFGNGRRLLERPFTEVLKSGKPDFPFCLAWANHSWSGIWLGSPDKILLEQTYPGKEDYKAHFESVVEAFADSRYLTVDGKPIFVIFEPHSLPNPREFTDYWQELSQQMGFPGIYFIGLSFSLSWNHRADGFAAFTSHPPKDVVNRLHHSNKSLIYRLSSRFLGKSYPGLFQQTVSGPHRYSYRKLMPYMTPAVSETLNFLPNIIPNWDNTPRSGRRGYVLEDSTPQLFGNVLRKAIVQVASKPVSERIVFIKAWNEWAEGNYLEPDQRWGDGYLKSMREVMQ